MGRVRTCLKRQVSIRCYSLNTLTKVVILRRKRQCFAWRYGSTTLASFIRCRMSKSPVTFEQVFSSKRQPAITVIRLFFGIYQVISAIYQPLLWMILYPLSHDIDTPRHLKNVHIRVRVCRCKCSSLRNCRSHVAHENVFVVASAIIAEYAVGELEKSDGSSLAPLFSARLASPTFQDTEFLQQEAAILITVPEAISDFQLLFPLDSAGMIATCRTLRGSLHPSS